MAAKFVALLALLGATVWCSRAPDWEPTIAILTSFAGLVALEVRDRKNVGTARERKEQHDVALFERLDTLLPERLMLDQLNGPLFNNETSRSFLDRLHAFAELAETTGSTFLIGSVQAAFAKYLCDVQELHGFISQHFFTSGPAGEAGATRYLLYPELKHRHETGGAAIYEQRRAELVQLLDDVATSLAAFRSTVKSELAR